MSELEQRMIFKKNINRLIDNSPYNQKEIAEQLGVSPQTLNTWTQGKAIPRMGKIQLLADFFQVDKTDLLEDIGNNLTPIQLGDSISIPVFGSVPAGIPIEAIQDISDYIDIPKSWTNGGKEYFALTVKGDSMYPKYLDGDVVVIRVEEDCESGQDCVVYINGYDATLKKVIKRDDYLILQPLNTKYEPRMFDLRDEATPPVKIAGVVVEIRRKV